MKKQLKIRMKKTLAPHEIPNGTEGVLYKSGREAGLFCAIFNGFKAFVFLDEVEILEGGE